MNSSTRRGALPQVEPTRGLPSPSRKTGPLLAFSVASLAVLSLTFPNRALAIAAPAPYTTVQLDSDRFPADGIVSGSVSCSVGCSGYAIEVTDAAGQVQNGTLIEGTADSIRAGFVWVPDEPLAPGTYTVTPLSGWTGTTFEVVESPTTVPFAMVQLLVASTPTGELVTCAENSSTLPELGFQEQALLRARLVPVIDGEMWHQFEYAVVQAGEEPPYYSRQVSTLIIEGEPNEICYEVLARSYLTKEVTTLVSDCSNTDGLQLGIVPEVSSNVDATLLRCVVPPEGYVDSWCGLFARAFSSGSCSGFDADACFAARRACPEGDDPSAEDESTERAMGTGGWGTGGNGSGTGGNGSGSGSNGSGSSGSAGSPASGGQDGTAGTSSTIEPHRTDTGGCATSRVAPRSWGFMALFFSCALFLLRRRNAST